MADHVLIRPDQVAAGVAAWSAADCSAPFESCKGAILGLSNAGTFGGDATGAAFSSSYQANGGPEATLFGEQGGQGLLSALAEYGPAMGESLRAVVASDEQAAAAVAAAGTA